MVVPGGEVIEDRGGEVGRFHIDGLLIAVEGHDPKSELLVGIVVELVRIRVGPASVERCDVDYTRLVGIGDSPHVEHTLGELLGSGVGLRHGPLRTVIT